MTDKPSDKRTWDDDEGDGVAEIPLSPEVPREPNQPKLYPVPLREPEPDADSRAASQFTIRDLLLVTAGAALWMGLVSSLLSRFPEGVVFSLGIFMFLSLVLLSLARPRRAIWFLAWWVLLGIYVLCCIVTIVRQLTSPPP